MATSIPSFLASNSFLTPPQSVPQQTPSWYRFCLGKNNYPHCAATSHIVNPKTLLWLRLFNWLLCAGGLVLHIYTHLVVPESDPKREKFYYVFLLTVLHNYSLIALLTINLVFSFRHVFKKPTTKTSTKEEPASARATAAITATEAAAPAPAQAGVSRWVQTVHTVLYSLVIPFSTVVTVAFWVALFEYPDEPVALQLCSTIFAHAVNSYFALFEVAFGRLCMPRLGFVLIFVFSALFVLWSFIFLKISDLHIYPILGKNISLLYAYYIGFPFAMCPVYVFYYYIHELREFIKSRYSQKIPIQI